jgi:DNA-directed RNA polymerase specialized sigma24 family protein
MTPVDAIVDSFAVRQAGIRASQLVKTLGLPCAERDDLRQELLLDYLRRRDRYQSGRGEHRGFIYGVVRNRASRLAVQGRRRSLVSEPVDDQVLLQHVEASLPAVLSAQALETQIDVRKLLTTLPEHLREVAVLLSEMSVPDVQRHTGKSRARIYQFIDEIRQAFREAGLAPTGGAR